MEFADGESMSTITARRIPQPGAPAGSGMLAHAQVEIGVSGNAVLVSDEQRNETR
jgi:hypothetical protein